MGQVVGNQFGHGATHDDGVTQVTRQQITQPNAVLHQQGLVEPIAGYQYQTLLGRRANLNHVVDWIARHQMDDHENDQ